LKRVLAITALLIGTAAAVAPVTASADDCAGVHVVADINVNGTPQNVDQCVPLGLPELP
jgi:hypothetical protein